MKDWAKQFEEKQERLRSNPDFPQNNKELVLAFTKYKQSQRLTPSRLNRILDFLWHFLDEFKFDFSKTSQDNVEEVLIWIGKQDRWKEWTKYSYIQILKNFLNWLVENYGLNLKLRKVVAKRPKNSVMPEYLITDEEFNKMINATDDLQLKSFMGVLRESGCRISEILTLKIQNISFNTVGARLYVKGKTGQRVVPIVWYANLLRQFIESHPNKDDPDTPLWFILKKGEMRALKYNAIRVTMHRLCRKVGIKKRINFHLFRHTRLTELARKVSDQTVKAFAGWTADSRMMKTYLHLSQKDVEDNLLSNVYGIKTENGKEEKLQVCSKCGEVNPHFAKICQRCKTDLDERKLMQQLITEEQVKEINEWSDVMLAFMKTMEKKNPEMWKEMANILRKKGKESLLES